MKFNLKNYWYILIYHNIDWEENWMLKSISNTLSPDIFFQQLNTLSNRVEFLDINQAHKKFILNELNNPTVSIWFDDGYKGCLRHAKQITDYFNIKPSVSICSNFVMRKEIFWRMKISFLNQCIKMPKLRNIFKKNNFVFDDFDQFLIQKFSLKKLKIIDELFYELTTSAFRQDVFRNFLDLNEIKLLQKEGWHISNHSRSHYPLSENFDHSNLIEEFNNCSLEGVDIMNYWSIPFSRYNFFINNLNKSLINTYNDKTIVFVRNRANKYYDNNNYLYRLDLGSLIKDRLLKFLSKV